MMLLVCEVIVTSAIQEDIMLIDCFGSGQEFYRSNAAWRWFRLAKITIQIITCFARTKRRNKMFHCKISSTLEVFQISFKKSLFYWNNPRDLIGCSKEPIALNDLTKVFRNQFVLKCISILYLKRQLCISFLVWPHRKRL